MTGTSSFDRPLDHRPGIGDPTPVVCEIVPRTQNAIFRDLYGETVIPRGTRLAIVSQDATTVTVSYLDGTYAIPIASTDLR